MNERRIGLLPCYLELYDQAMPERRTEMERFYGVIADALAQQGAAVRRAPLCRKSGEFGEAVRRFEQDGAEAIITLHLAYSPSLESIDALAGTRLPLIVLDTTPDHDFGPGQSPDAIMYNHGIHGVQDMCNLLLRRGKPFVIEAGHWERSDVIARALRWLNAARMARQMAFARIGRIGEPFAGMGDFAVAPEELAAFIGMETVPCAPETLRELTPAADDPAVLKEMEADRRRFNAAGLAEDVHRRSVQVGLGVRRWLERERLTGFSVNFLAANRAAGLATVPFLEASKAMGRGLGYAGEGDVLTAALVSALAAVYPTTFTEMFCPDWQGETVFLSHMGEMNVDLAVGKPRLLEKPFPWGDAGNPAVAVGCLRGGEALFVDLAPAAGGAYRLIIAPVTMMEPEGEDKMAETIHGWLRPKMPVAEFLAAYSRVGGTHHAALAYGAGAEDAEAFGRFMGWETVVL